MIQQVREEIKTIGTAIREAVALALETELKRVLPEDLKSVAAVQGMPPIDPAGPGQRTTSGRRREPEHPRRRSSQ
jgi:hypothetical protein